ncbi:MAG: MaoC family dehydratase [Pseudolabrys sp.]|nr:MaoC family dehydratase [Pseudolabrys sp.]MCW5684494.1 MaoC family dehydratase [Pseudolabrys sp.]
MIEVDTPAELAAHAGQELGVGDWLLVDQERINGFADATGDHQWIHVDVERAAREAPGGKTIAHGYLTLSLLPLLSQTVFKIRRRSRGINYGTDKVRFISPVPSGSRIRARQTLLSATPVDGGYRFVYEATVEIEKQERPALIAQTISIAYA